MTACYSFRDLAIYTNTHTIERAIHMPSTDVARVYGLVGLWCPSIHDSDSFLHIEVRKIFTLKFPSITDWNIFVVVDEQWRIRQDGDDTLALLTSNHRSLATTTITICENEKKKKKIPKERKRRKQRTSRNNKAVKAWMYLEQDQSDGRRQRKEKCRMTFSDS